MIRTKLNELIARFWVRVFMWSGDHVFPITVVWRETPEHEFSVAHFAWSQRDLNCAVRDYVEELDKDYVDNTSEPRDYNPSGVVNLPSGS